MGLKLVTISFRLCYVIIVMWVIICSKLFTHFYSTSLMKLSRYTEAYILFIVTYYKIIEPKFRIIRHRKR
jgi:hypothetical protein